jgi:hypothetical protein
VLRRERGKRWEKEGRRPVIRKKKEEGQDKGEQRRRTSGIPQGLICNFRKLQGPVCKARISHQSKSLMKKCPKRKLESFSNSTTLL